MQKKLNVEQVNLAMQEKGMTQTSVASALSVSKEAVSQWINEKVFPRPNKLLQLGKLLNLSVKNLVISTDNNMPKVAFRKMKGTKTKDCHIEKAQAIGYLLKQLTEYLPFDTLEVPPTLKSPTCDYSYLCQVTSKVRKDIGIDDDTVLTFQHLIKRFKTLQAVIIPVLWGSKSRHENAIHIYLPDSKTTWIYLNLDTNIHDFKFWMSHELGHCLSPSLDGDESEDFADAFASHILFPEKICSKAYDGIVSLKSNSDRVNKILEWADKYVISPITVHQQINKFANHYGKDEITFSKSFYGVVTNFNKKFPNLSEALFTNRDEKSCTLSSDFIKTAEDGFETPIFSLLSRYIKEKGKSASFVQSVLDLSPLDARSIYSELL